MTSSFSTVIGTPRDDIPKLPVSNYADSAPDLTEAVEEGNEAFKEDLARHFDSVAKIEELRVKNFWDNLSGLEQLLGKANEFKQIKDANRDAEEKLKGLKNINKEELDKQSGKLDRIMKLEEAERISELIKLTREGNARERLIATDLLNQNVLPTGEEIKFDDAKTRFDNTTNSVFINIAEKNFLITQQTLGGAKLVADNAIRDILTDFYYEMRLAGFDINSRQVQNYIDRDLLPSLMKEKDKQISTWTAYRPQVVQKNLARKNKEDIIEAFTSKAEVTTISESGQEIKTVKHNGVFDAEDGEGGLLERLMARNGLENKAQAIDFIIETLTNDPLLKHKINVEDLEYFKEEARFLDTSKEGKEIFGFANSSFGSLDGVMRFFDDYEKKLATSNKDAYDNVILIMEQRVRDHKGKFGPKLTEGHVLHFATMFNNELRKRNLPTGGPLPGFIQGDETITDWKYGVSVEAVGHINNKRWERAISERNATSNQPTSPTINAQIERAKAELRIKVEEAASQDENANIQALVDEFYPDILDKLANGEYIEERDLLRPLLPADREKEQNTMLADRNKWLDNKEVNSIYEKRYLDQYVEEYAKGGYLPEKIPTYIKKLAQAAGLSPHAYVMRRLVATGVYDKDTMKFLSKNPEDVFNLTEDEKTYLFVKPMSSKNLLLYSGKEGGLNGKEAKEALMIMRKKGDNVDYIGEGRNLGRRFLNFINPATETKTVGDILTLVDQGFDDFGLYGFKGEDLKRLVKAGILDPNADFDENAQDFAAWGLMYLQANDSQSIMGAQTEALDWRYLTGLSETEQQTVLQFFPNLHKAPMNQFQNMQKDVSNAIITDVEGYQLSTQKFVEDNPDFADIFKDTDSTFKFIRSSTRLPGLRDDELAADPRREKVFSYFQQLVKDGKFIPDNIKYALQRISNELPQGDPLKFNYYQKPKEEE